LQFSFGSGYPLNVWQPCLWGSLKHSVVMTRSGRSTS
jgi:hypothetical protein